MEMPITLRAAIDGLTENGNFTFPELREAAAAMSEKYRNESGSGKRLVTRECEIAAYATVRMPATFASVASALENVPTDLKENIRTVLDVGAGTGAASWAAESVLPLADTFVLVERENEMIACGKRLAQSAPTLARAEWFLSDYVRDNLPGKADLVAASYTLNELSEADREKTLDKLMGAAEKCLLLVEPGTPVGYGILKEAREHLIGRGYTVLAPCPGNVACPLPDGDWCQFTCRVARSKLHKMLKGGDAPYEDENFIYLIAVPAGASSVPETGARVLRHPEKSAGRIVLKLCTRDGLVIKTVTKKDGDLFKAARKATGGEKISQ